ncbi:methionine synthase [Rhodococcus aerolatus]
MAAESTAPPVPEAGTALPTAVGSWPGVDALAAATVVTGELGALPHLVELPARGVGADLVGRAGALLVDLPLEVVASGWRTAERPGRDGRRAHALLREDLDALEEALERGGHTPPAVKVQAAGPWTLAAAVELRTGHRVLTDPGAVRELAASLAEGVAGHVAEVARRVGAPVVLQLDEPGLRAVLDGTVPTVTGMGNVGAVPDGRVVEVLRTVVDAATAAGASVAVHSCAGPVPLGLLRAAGAAAVGLDLTTGRTLAAAELDGVGEALEAGTALVLGLVPPLAPTAPPGLAELAAPALRLLDGLGIDRAVLARQWVSPGCGLAGASQEWARRALGLTVELGRALAEPPEAWARD